MNKKRPHFIHFGPSIEFVPRKDFHSVRLETKDLEDVWSRIIGPTAEKNIGQGLDMWKVITLAYLEGLSHGPALVELSNLKEETHHVES